MTGFSRHGFLGEINSDSKTSKVCNCATEQHGCQIHLESEYVPVPNFQTIAKTPIEWYASTRVPRGTGTSINSARYLNFHFERFTSNSNLWNNDRVARRNIVPHTPRRTRPTLVNAFLLNMLHERAEAAAIALQRADTDTISRGLCTSRFDHVASRIESIYGTRLK